MIHFAWPWLLLALPLPLLVYWLPAKNQGGVAALNMPIIMDGIDNNVGSRNKNTRSILFLTLVWILLVLAASRPQWLGEAVNIPTESREMMIAVDLSGSMKAEDMRLNGNVVNRLQMLKVVLGDFIDRRSGDRLGLIFFGDDAYMQTPMTFDRKTVKQMLDESVIGLVGQQTAIGDSIALAVKRFAQKEESNRVLLLLTDGRNTAGKITPDEALELAVSRDITIYTVGIGADENVRKSLSRSDSSLINSLFSSGTVRSASDLDEGLLSKIAKQTGGEYFRATSGKSMEEIYQMLDQLEPVAQEQKQMRPVSAMFFWPLALALFISCAYIFGLTLAPKLARQE